MVESADERRSRTVGRLLRAGVTLAAAVVVSGAIPYLRVHGFERPDYAVFRGEPQTLRSASGIVRDALAGDSRGILQLGILILIATPVARVVLLLADFARDRDTLYVAVTAGVLGVLAYSLFGSGFL
ncbi:MAG TPA: DUF1634 domain-containing protein [Thermoanaerobaculia bacterium]|nr:DUF1634 domain-containing protein [Thermoanaerobaculia bacterium]